MALPLSGMRRPPPGGCLLHPRNGHDPADFLRNSAVCWLYLWSLSPTLVRFRSYLAREVAAGSDTPYSARPCRHSSSDHAPISRDKERTEDRTRARRLAAERRGWRGPSGTSHESKTLGKRKSHVDPSTVPKLKSIPGRFADRRSLLRAASQDDARRFLASAAYVLQTV